MNHATTEIRYGKDLLGQSVHFPVNAEKLLSTARFFSWALSSLNQIWQESFNLNPLSGCGWERDGLQLSVI